LFLWTAGTLPSVLIAVLAFGVAGGMLAVGLNAQGVQVEQAYGRPLMASFHACFSVGGLAGALLGGLLAWRQAAPAGHPQTAALAVLVLAGLAVAVIAGRWLPPDPAPRGRRPPPPPVLGRWAAVGTAARLAFWRGCAVRPGRLPGHSRLAWPGRPARAAPGSSRLAGLGVLALCCLIAEGAAANWSGVYLREDLGAAPGYAAAGFGGFSLAMAAGRMAGDRLAARYGPVCLIRGCGLLASAGLAAALLSRSPVGAVIGFAACGGGLSCTMPQFLSAAGHADPEHPGRGIARVAGLGYLGLVGGPPLIGGCASVAGLPAALCIPVALGLCVAYFGAIVEPGRALQEPRVPALDPAGVCGSYPARPAGSRSR
jgi:fucose permease